MRASAIWRQLAQWLWRALRAGMATIWRLSLKQRESAIFKDKLGNRSSLWREYETVDPAVKILLAVNGFSRFAFWFS